MQDETVWVEGLVPGIDFCNHGMLSVLIICPQLSPFDSCHSIGSSSSSSSSNLFYVEKVHC